MLKLIVLYLNNVRCKVSEAFTEVHTSRLYAATGQSTPSASRPPTAEQPDGDCSIEINREVVVHYEWAG